jgi:putative effector of murein hydrolase
VSLAVAASLTVTLVAYLAAERLDRRVRSPWTNPVGLTVVAGVLLVAATPISLPAYERGTAPLTWALRPAVVALGWLAYQQRAVLRRWAAPLLVGSTVGSLVSLAITPLLARWAGADPVLQTALALKSVTSAVGVDLAGRLGAEAALSVPLVIVTGIVGAALGPPLLRALGLDEAAEGIALGTNSHGIGTAALAAEDRAAGAALSGLAMAVTAVVSGVLAPLVLALLRLP